MWVKLTTDDKLIKLIKSKFDFSFKRMNLYKNNHVIKTTYANL